MYDCLFVYTLGLLTRMEMCVDVLMRCDPPLSCECCILLQGCFSCFCPCFQIAFNRENRGLNKWNWCMCVAYALLAYEGLCCFLGCFERSNVRRQYRIRVRINHHLHTCHSFADKKELCCCSAYLHRGLFSPFVLTALCGSQPRLLYTGEPVQGLPSAHVLHSVRVNAREGSDRNRQLLHIQRCPSCAGDVRQAQGGGHCGRVWRAQHSGGGASQRQLQVSAGIHWPHAAKLCPRAATRPLP